MEPEAMTSPNTNTITVEEALKIGADAVSIHVNIGNDYENEMLEDFGPQRVGLPHVRPLESTLWEMRLHGKDGIARAVYVALQGRQLHVLHVFVKKTQKTPRKAIATALARMKAHGS